MTENKNEHKIRDIYCAFQNKVAKINDVTVSKTYDIENVTDIAYLDKLYVLAKDGVYAAIGNSLIKIFDVENAKRITVAKDGANVYLLTDTSVISIDRNGKKLALLADGDFQEAIDLAIDYQGKAYVVFEDKITTITGDDIQNVYPTSASMKATLTSACLDGENLVFTAKESFVGSMNLNATTKQNFSPAQPQPTIYAYYFATANDDALNYSADGRIENISAASGDTYLVLDSVIEGDETENYRYAYVGRFDKISFFVLFNYCPLRVVVSRSIADSCDDFAFFERCGRRFEIWQRIKCCVLNRNVIAA